MSFSQQIFGFTPPNPSIDGFVNKAFPAVTLLGTETNGGWVQLIEVAGAWYLTINANYDTFVAGFQQMNPLLPSACVTLSPSGTFQKGTAAAGAPLPLVWTFTTIT